MTLALGRGVQVTADDEPAVEGPEHAAAVAERHVSEVDGPAPATGSTVVTLAPGVLDRPAGHPHPRLTHARELGGCAELGGRATELGDASRPRAQR